MEEQKYKTEYKAITTVGLHDFNNELTAYAKNGWVPQSNFQCTPVLLADAIPPTVKFFYHILLSKTTKI